MSTDGNNYISIPCELANADFCPSGADFCSLDTRVVGSCGGTSLPSSTPTVSPSNSPTDSPTSSPTNSPNMVSFFDKNGAEVGTFDVTATQIDLNGRNITSIPSRIGILTNLEELRLSKTHVAIGSQTV